MCGYRFDVYRDPEVWLSHPDYYRDLNAMHEAEKIFDNGQILRYVQWLPRGALSTAAQRAEAFLRTLNLWRDTPSPCN